MTSEVTRILPGLTWWWQGDLAGYIDFTNAEAVTWWTERLEKLRYIIETFPFQSSMPSELKYLTHSVITEMSLQLNLSFNADIDGYC